MTDLGLRQLGINIAATLGRQLGAGLFQIATLAVIARVYGPEGNGAYTVALLLPTMLASLLNLGIGPANVYFLGAGKVSPRTAWHKTLALYAGLVVTGMLIGVFVLLFFAGSWFPGVPERLLWFALSVFPFSLLLNFVSSFYQGLQQFKQFNLVLLLQPIITLLGITFLVVIGNESIGWLLSAYLVGVFLTLIVSIKLLKPLLVSGDDEQPDYAKASLNYGVKAHLSNIVTFLNYKSDIFLVNLFVGPIAAGVYVIAVQLAERLWMLSTAVSTVLLPRLAQLSSTEEKKQALTPLACRWTLVLTLIGTVLLLVIARPLISLVFGEAFLDAVLVLWFLAPGVVLWAGARVLSNDIASRGRPEVNFYISLLVLIINIVGNLALIPIYGMKGAAIATSLAYVSDFMVKSYIYSNIVGLGFFSFVVFSSKDIQLIKQLRKNLA